MEKVTRILHVLRSMKMGGAQNLIMNLYRNINTKKIQFDFLLSEKGTFDEEIIKMGGKIYYIPYLTQVGQEKYEKQIIKFLKDHEEYKIVHSHIDQVTGIIMQAAKKAGVKVRIAHSHSTGNTNNLLEKIYKKYLQNKINKNATNLFACSENAAKWLYKNKYKEAVIIKNGIDVEKFQYNSEKRNKIREELGVSENTILIGHVGSFSKVKNHKFLIDVFDEYQKEVNDTKLILVGEGILQEEIKKKVELYGLENKVEFLGKRMDTDYIYSALDIFVFPSYFEGICTAMIEAQSEGLPIITSDEIDRNTDITKTIKFLRLNEGINKWTDAVKNVEKINRNNQSIKKMIIENGYDIKENAKNIQKLYNEFYTKSMEDKNE